MNMDVEMVDSVLQGKSDDSKVERLLSDDIPSNKEEEDPNANKPRPTMDFPETVTTRTSTTTPTISNVQLMF